MATLVISTQFTLEMCFTLQKLQK